MANIALPGAQVGKMLTLVGKVLTLVGKVLTQVGKVPTLVGKVLKSLAVLNMSNNTVVLFTGNHGQNLGERNTWSNMMAWEHSVRIPLIIAVPWHHTIKCTRGCAHPGG